MSNIDNEKCGSFMMELWKEKGLTQKEFGEKLCVSDKIISKWKLSRYPILAKALELSYEELALELSYEELLDGWIWFQHKKRKILLMIVVNGWQFYILIIEIW